MNVNNISFRPVSYCKAIVVKPGRSPRRVLRGLYSGLALNLDLSTETQIYLGLWERETHRFIRSTMSKCDWCIDVGAGNGELSILFAAATRIVRVIACEPAHEQVSTLKTNLSLNKPLLKGRVEVVNKFVGTQADMIKLDELVVDRRQRGLVKIDVDGNELDVLRSGEELLSSGKAYILVETHSNELERDCIKWLESHGYEARIVKNAWWRAIIPEHRPRIHNRWLWAQKN